MRPGVTLYFIRHGQTDWNAQSRYQGQRDIPLNDHGRGQARRNGEALRDVVRDHTQFDFAASPMLRTMETMTIVREVLGLSMEGVRLDDRLREMHYGHWEGQLASELPQLDPDGVAGRAADPWNWQPRGGESYEMLATRVRPWIAELERDTVVASHGGVSRAVRHLLLGVDRGDVPRLEVPQNRILVICDGRMDWL